MLQYCYSLISVLLSPLISIAYVHTTKLRVHNVCIILGYMSMVFVHVNCVCCTCVHVCCIGDASISIFNLKPMLMLIQIHIRTYNCCPLLAFQPFHGIDISCTATEDMEWQDIFVLKNIYHFHLSNLS